MQTATLNGLDPQAWPTLVLGRIAAHKINRLGQLITLCYAAQVA
ncbi:MAG: transposase domain-containing protein [Pseudomonadota bacterium]